MWRNWWDFYASSDNEEFWKTQKRSLWSNLLNSYSRKIWCCRCCNPFHDLCIRIWDHLPVGRHAKYQVLCCMILACEHAVEKRQEKVFRCPIWLWWSGDAFSFHIIVRSDHWSLVFDNWQLHFDLILHHMLRRISLHDSALNPGCSRLPRYWKLTSSLELMVLI